MVKIGLEIEWLGKEDFKIRFNSKTMNDLVIAKSQVPLEQIGGEAQELLAASAAECMGSTLLFLLKWAQIKFKDLRETVEINTEKDEQGRNYVGSINLNLFVDIQKDEETTKKFERIKNIISRGCFISRSLERGIKVNCSIVA